jgi:hypothetical protein
MLLFRTFFIDVPGFPDVDYNTLFIVVLFVIVSFLQDFSVKIPASSSAQQFFPDCISCTMQIIIKTEIHWWCADFIYREGSVIEKLFAVKSKVLFSDI